MHSPLPADDMIYVKSVASIVSYVVKVVLRASYSRLAASDSCIYDYHLRQCAVGFNPRSDRLTDALVRHSLYCVKLMAEKHALVFKSCQLAMPTYSRVLRHPSSALLDL